MVHVHGEDLAWSPKAAHLNSPAISSGGKGDQTSIAVPQDRVVPTFIEGTFWEFAGTLGKDSFERAPALTGVHLLGLYLFQGNRRHESIGADFVVAA
jgi:hypothetical protein